MFDHMLPMDRRTYIDQWPSELMRLSFATVLIKLSKQSRRDILNGSAHSTGIGFEPNEERWLKFLDRLDQAVSQFPDGAFVRLASRSPKDSWEGHRGGFRVRNGQDAMDRLLDSERIVEDLHLDIRDNATSYIAIREWRDIPLANEWRVFIHEGKIIGVSQYGYLDKLPKYEDLGGLRWALDVWFTNELKPALHLNTVIADVWLRQYQSAPRTFLWECKLIEINPFGAWTDPCLFDWRNEGSFRSQPYQIRTVYDDDLKRRALLSVGIDSMAIGTAGPEGA